MSAAAAKSLQSCPTLCDPMDCSLLGSSVHGIFQARVLEWVAIAFSTICQQIWKTQQWPQDCKDQFSFQSQRSNAKECSNYHTVALISTLARLYSKSDKLAFSSIWTENFQMYNPGFEETEVPEIKLPAFIGLWRKQGGVPEKHLLLLYWLH